MKILGNRVYLSLPELPEYKVTVPDDVKKQIQREILEKTEKLEVYAKGEGMGEGKVLIEKVSVGDKVYVDPGKLNTGSFFVIDGKNKVSVSVFDIAHIW